MSDKAKRQEVSIGTISLEGFQMPDGSYRMSITSAAIAVATSQQNATNFLRSKTFKALRGNASTPQTLEEVEVERTRIVALPLDVAMYFWIYQCSRGNKEAMRLLAALATETLERRFDDAFAVTRSEAERQTRLTERMDISREEFEALAEAMAEPDLLRAENELLKQQLKDAGIDPWALPQEPN